MIKPLFSRSITVAVIVSLVIGSFTPASAQRPVELGISTGGSLLNMPPQALSERLLDMKRLGATWIRVDFSWGVIQPYSAETYDFRYHDRVVIAAEDAGIKVMGLLSYTPAWARSTQCAQLAGPLKRHQEKCIPSDPSQFAAFARMTANRYRQHNIHAWEIWNEPNVTGYWKHVGSDGTFHIDPLEYVRLANQTAHSIHAVDPNVTIVTGGLAPLFEPSPTTGMRQSDFLRAILPHLDRGGVAAIGLHPYSWPASPRKAADWNAFYNVDQGDPEYNLHDILIAANRRDLKIWGTEYGASTIGAIKSNPSAKPRPGARPDHVDETKQAQIVKEGIENWYTKPNTGPLFIYADSDQYLTRYKNEKGFGLRRHDGTPKPAYDAAVRALANAQSSINN